MKRLILAVALLIVGAWFCSFNDVRPVKAQFNGCPAGFCGGPSGSGGGGGGSYSGPADVVASPVVFWGGQAVSAAYATSNGKLLNVTLTTNSHTCDILAATNGNIGNTANCSNGGDNGISASSFCGTNCTVGTIYDQIGTNCAGSTACDLIAGAPAAFVIVSSRGYADCPAGGCSYGTTVNFTVAQPFTLSSVINNTSEGVQSNWFGCNPIQYGVQNSGVNTVFLYSGSSLPSATASDGSFHAIQAVYNNASSDIYVDGTANTSNLGNTTGCSAQPLSLMYMSGSGQNIKGRFGQIGIWASAFSTGNKSAMNSNEHTNWGF